MDKRPKAVPGARGSEIERIVGKGASVDEGAKRTHVILSADMRRRIDALIAKDADRSGVAVPNRSLWIREAIMQRLEREEGR